VVAVVVQDDAEVIEPSSWRSRVWAAAGSAPWLLKVSMLAFVLLLFGSVLCMLLRLSSPANVLVGGFGAAAAILGSVLVLDVSGAATAMERLADAVASGLLRVSGGRWTARRYRALGGAFVVLGCLLAVVGWAGVIGWKP